MGCGVSSPSRAVPAQTSSLHTTNLSNHAYTYQPLSHPTAIRMVRILPGSPHQPVEISLQIHTLPDMAKCVAMSYQWGNPSELHVVYCQGKKLHVTTNLLRLLKQLRQSGKTTLKDLFWIDALCINQTDLDEKAHQVPLMRSIYQNAAFVWIWLGEGSLMTAEAFSTIRLLSQEENEFFKKKNVPHNIHSPSELVHGKKVQKLAEAPSWSEVQNLYDSEYFGRVWTLQEMVLAPASKLNIICGVHNISWDEFCAAANLVQHCTFLEKNWLHVESLLIISTIKLFRERHKRDSLPLFGLVSNATCATGVTYPCDRIFGILGMLPEGATRSSIRVDYRAPIEKVFQNAASSIVTYEHMVTFLWALNYRPEDRTKAEGGENWPSWVPDFTDRIQILIFSTRPVTGLGDLYTSVCSCDKIEGQNPKHYVEDDTLILWGFILDAVSEVTENFPRRTAWDESTSFENPDWWQDGYSLLQVPIKEHAHLSAQESSSLLQSLIMFNPFEIDQDLMDASTKNGTLNQLLDAEFGYIFKGFSELLIYWWRQQLSSASDEVSPPSLSEQAKKFYKKMYDNMVMGPRSRNLFRLRDGGFGIGPTAVTEGIAHLSKPAQKLFKQVAGNMLKNSKLPNPLLLKDKGYGVDFTAPDTDDDDSVGEIDLDSIEETERLEIENVIAGLKSPEFGKNPEAALAAAAAVAARVPAPKLPLPPPAVQPGDIIAIICGYDKPLVLRRKVEQDSASVSEPRNGKGKGREEKGKVYYTLIGNAFIGAIEDFAKERKAKRERGENGEGFGELRKFYIK